MRAAIYARFSSQNQRRESIDDQVASCHRLAADKGFRVLDSHLYVDEAKSGASMTRPGLLALVGAAKERLFDVVLVFDLSRLARDNMYMLVTLANLQYEGVRLMSVVDGVDTADPHSRLLIQVLGVVNEHQLETLRHNTLRGQLGQKDRGYSVGEATFGYLSKPVGEMRLDKHGRARPDGYKQFVNPPEASVVRRIFEDYADGVSKSGIVHLLNDASVPSPKRCRTGWRPSTVFRLLNNQKYIGIWIWNRTCAVRDPLTGARRHLAKPESEHRVEVDERFRIVPQELWDRVQARQEAVHKVWPGKRRGFSSEQTSRAEVYPIHLLDGMMRCGCCRSRVTLRGGKNGGYYGCSARSRGACDNSLTVNRSCVEKVFLGAIRDRLLEPGAIVYALGRVAERIRELSPEVEERRAGKQAEFRDTQKRLDRFVEFIAGDNTERSTFDSLSAAIAKCEARLSTLSVELETLKADDASDFRVPAEEWIAERVRSLQELLERRTSESARVLRRLLGEEVVLEPVTLESGRRYYLARTAIDVFALVDPSGLSGGPDGGSRSLHWWRRPGSNRGPYRPSDGRLRT